MSPEDEVRTEWPFGGASVSDQWSRWCWAHMAPVVMRSWWGHRILVSDWTGETWTPVQAWGDQRAAFARGPCSLKSKPGTPGISWDAIEVRAGGLTREDVGNEREDGLGESRRADRKEPRSPWGCGTRRAVGRVGPGTGLES